MATQQPPDGWVMKTGDWNVDASAFTGSSIGSTALHFGNSTTLTSMVGPWIPLNALAAVNQYYEASIQIQNVVLPANFTVAFVSYDSTRATVLDTQTLVAGTIGGPISPTITFAATANAVWGRFEITKNITTGRMNVYEANLRLVPPHFSVLLATTRSIPVSGAFTNVVLDGTASYSGSKTFNGGPAGTSVVLLRSGVWLLNFSAYMAAVPNGKFIACRIVDNSGSSVPMVPQGGPIYAGSAGGDLVVSCSGIVRIPDTALATSTQDIITVQVVHNNTAALNLFGTAGAGVYATKFTGVHVGA